MGPRMSNRELFQAAPGKAASTRRAGYLLIYALRPFRLAAALLFLDPKEGTRNVGSMRHMADANV